MMMVLKVCCCGFSLVGCVLFVFGCCVVGLGVVLCGGVYLCVSCVGVLGFMVCMVV